ncbi:MAG: hypothetical protein LBT25_13145 [Candidatus Symbiothrix sp.]|jgi:hypothetical protein|nr:hypothetical protein [Candidatus Symbiothrix sp.]
MLLNEAQIEKVKMYLENSDIKNSLIFGDFLDHLCCIIEQKINTGFSFEASMEFAMQELSGSTIKTIELFTLKLLNMETSFSSRTALSATIPFGLYGIAWAFSNSGMKIPAFILSFVFIVSVLSMFVVLGIGWVKNFPRWSFPAIGFSLFLSLYFMMVTIPDFSPALLGYWAWMPLFITMLVCLMLRPTLKPIRQLAKKIKAEPSLIIFILYGFVPFFVSLFCDETHSIWMFFIALIATSVLSFGLYFFLRSDRKKTRIILITMAALVTTIITFAASYFYWK